MDTRTTGVLSSSARGPGPGQQGAQEAFSAARQDAYANIAIVFILLVSTQWLSQPIRSSVFQRHVNTYEEATVKEYSTLCMIPVVILYNLLCTLVPQKQVVTWVCVFYGLLFVFFGVYLTVFDLYENALLKQMADSETWSPTLFFYSAKMRRYFFICYFDKYYSW